MRKADGLCRPLFLFSLRASRQPLQIIGLEDHLFIGRHVQGRAVPVPVNIPVLPYSTIVETDPADGVTYDILYDILIKQNGDIHGDWDGTPLDVEAYEQVVFEPYDLKWLARIA